jgi:hypothetical protein
MGFSRKDAAKRCVVKSLIVNTDYTITDAGQSESGHARGGANKEVLKMTVEAFKRVCMTAGTPEAVVVQKYFIKMEIAHLRNIRKLLAERQQCLELIEHHKTENGRLVSSSAAALEAAKVQAVVEAKIARHNTLLVAHQQNACVYLAECFTLPDGRTVRKIGETDNTKNRYKSVVSASGKLLLTDVFHCTQAHALEQSLLKSEIITRLRYDGYVNGVPGREYIVTNSAEYEAIKRLIKRKVDDYMAMTPAQQMQKLQLQLKIKAIEGLAACTDPDVRSRLLDVLSQTHVHDDCDDDCDDTSQQVDPDDPVGADELPSDSSDAACQNDANIVSGARAVSVASVVWDTRIVSGADVNTAAATDANDDTDASSPHLFPPQPKKKLGRTPKVTKKYEPLAAGEDASTSEPPGAHGFDSFVSECFDLGDGARTLKAMVKARHRLWSRQAGQALRSALTEFFDERFKDVLVFDAALDANFAYYEGLALKPWAPSMPSDVHPDIAEFVRDACEPHVMGRAAATDLKAAFVAWKRANGAPEYADTMSLAEEARFRDCVGATFVWTQVPVDGSGVCVTGCFGLYLKSAPADAEIRRVGYNCSPNTRHAVFKLDARGNKVAILDSMAAVAQNVIHKTLTHTSRKLNEPFQLGRGFFHKGYAYIKQINYDPVLIAQALASGK